MDAHQQQHQKSTTQAAAATTTTKKRSIVSPPHNGGRRQLSFRIRRRGFTFEGGASLLITDGDGVWSVAHRRYIRTTRQGRFRFLKAELDAVRTAHASWVRRFGPLDAWPQYARDEELRSLRRNLADFYWGVMPAAEKRRTVRFYRDRRRRSAESFAVLVFLAFAAFVLTWLLLVGLFGVRVTLVLVSGYLVARCLRG